MAKYLLEASYTTEGVKGLAKDGGSKRRDKANAAIKSLGGKMEVFYFAFGDPDAVLIVDLPDNVSAAAASVAIGATGAVRIKTVVLLSPKDLDAAVKKTVKYSPPGR